MIATAPFAPLDLGTPSRLRGMPGIAIRLGAALERWGREHLVDRDVQRRRYENLRAAEARMRAAERTLLRRY